MEPSKRPSTRGFRKQTTNPPSPLQELGTSERTLRARNNVAATAATNAANAAAKPAPKKRGRPAKKITTKRAREEDSEDADGERSPKRAKEQHIVEQVELTPVQKRQASLEFEESPAKRVRESPPVLRTFAQSPIPPPSTPAPASVPPPSVAPTAVPQVESKVVPSAAPVPAIGEHSDDSSDDDEEIDMEAAKKNTKEWKANYHAFKAIKAEAQAMTDRAKDQLMSRQKVISPLKKQAPVNHDVSFFRLNLDLQSLTIVADQAQARPSRVFSFGQQYETLYQSTRLSFFCTWFLFQTVSQ